MPLEVRELVISISVESENVRKQAKKADMPPPPKVDAIVAECVDRVLEILRERSER